MKANVIIGAVLVIVMVAAALMVATPEQPIQVLGGLSKREIADIRKAVWHKTHPPILPDFSLKSFLAAPGLIVQRFSNQKIFKIEARNRAFVAVFGRSAADANRHRYVFWCVFRDTNSWLVEEEYHLTDR